jgi:hypothetical protein
MKKILSTVTLGLASIAIGAAGSASAATYQVTFDFADLTVAGTTYDQAVWTFATSKTSGTIDSTDLTDLTMEVYNGGSLLYTDQAIIGGATQTLNGFARILNASAPSGSGGIFFDVDLDLGEVLFYDNYFSVTGFGAPQGANGDLNLFNNFSGDPIIYINTGATFAGILSSQTFAELDAEAVPLPAAAWLFVPVMGGIVARSRKRRA